MPPIEAIEKDQIITAERCKIKKVCFNDDKIEIIIRGKKNGGVLTAKDEDGNVIKRANLAAGEEIIFNGITFRGK